MVFTKNKEKMVVNKNIDINIDSYPISMAISIVTNIVEIEIDIEISLTPDRQTNQEIRDNQSHVRGKF